jgi:hypothetical protein
LPLSTNCLNSLAHDRIGGPPAADANPPPVREANPAAAEANRYG